MSACHCADSNVATTERPEFPCLCLHFLTSAVQVAQISTNFPFVISRQFASCHSIIAGTVSSSRLIMAASESIDVQKNRYPFCIVWTPIPLITWIFPFIGHMGICTSAGVIRDFAGSYFVSEDQMGFGDPTKYLQLEISRVPGGVSAWDRAVQEASEEYKSHVHNLFCDNCHSHVALAMNNMSYPGKRNWNMVAVCWQILLRGKHVGCAGFLRTWLPSLFFYSVIAVIVVFLA